MLYSNNVVPLHVPITTVIRERSRSQTVVKNYGHQLRRHPESERINQRVPWSTLVYLNYFLPKNLVLSPLFVSFAGE